MLESEWVRRGGVRIQAAVDSAEVYRGEAVTGRLVVQVPVPSRRWVPELSVALRWGAAGGGSTYHVEQTVLNKYQPDSSEPQHFRYSLHVPASTLLGPAELVVKANRGMLAWKPVARMPLTILPERCLVEVIEIVNALADHWVGSWATSADGSGIYARLLPNPEVQDRMSGITVELRQVGRYVRGELTVTARGKVTWLDTHEDTFTYPFQAPMEDLDRLRPRFHHLLHPLLGEERQLPIPHHAEESSDGLPIPAG